MEKVITGIDSLKALSSRSEGCDCYIKLNFGLRSSKHITYDGSKWYVLNLSDDTEQELTDKELGAKTNIIEALGKNALILDD